MAFDPTIIPDTSKLSMVISPSDVSSDQTGFPLAIQLDNADPLHTPIFSSLGTNSKKLAITQSGIQLPVEIEAWTTTRATLHAKVPSISSSMNTELILSWDSGQVDNVQVGDTGDAISQTVWDGDFAAVYHMAQDPSGTAPQILDSTSYANHGTSYGTMLSGDLVDGVVGKAIDYDGADDYINIPDASQLDVTTALTMEVMNKPRTLVNNGVMMKGNLSNDQGVYSLAIASAGAGQFFRLNGSSVEGSGQLTGSVPTAGVWQHMVGTYDQTTQKLIVDGAVETSSGWTTAINTNSDPLFVGVYFSSSYTFDGFISEVRLSSIARSADWVALTNLSLTDSLITFSEIGLLVRAFADLLYGSPLSPISGFLDEVYHILSEVLSHADLVYGLRLGASVSIPYGNSPLVQNICNLVYGDRQVLVKFLDMFYGNNLGLVSYLDLPYTIRKGLSKFLDENYSVAEKDVVAFLDAFYSLSPNNPISGYSDLVYAVAGRTKLEQSSLVVKIDGVRVYPFHLNFEFNQDLYGVSAEAHFARQEDYLLCKKYSSVLEIEDDDVHLFLTIEIPRRSRTPGKTFYIVPATSPSVVLERAEALTEEFPAGMISEIAKSIAIRYGVTLDWEVYDWFLPSGYVYANDETPLDIIRRLSGSVGAVLQPRIDGSGIVVKKAKKVNSNKIGTASPDHYLTDQENFFGTEETPSERDGWNIYNISDHTVPKKNMWLEYEQVSGRVKLVKGFHVPFGDSDVDLETSGGVSVLIEPMGTVIELVEEELVEIVNGKGKTTQPIYSLVQKSYDEDSLGEITYSEDGTLTTAVPGQSLVRITYNTKYRLWKATSDKIGEVQFYLEEI